MSSLVFPYHPWPLLPGGGDYWQSSLLFFSPQIFAFLLLKHYSDYCKSLLPYYYSTAPVIVEYCSRFIKQLTLFSKLT